ncbi:unnamed protein product [Symbiodinium necroappetens]|uniref:Uncharacterized protein n=1 Tax=Symbiodinium necroappetens TaxID=1628268 RepID=A0A813B842_9DINO|nr:unnamed protein product [Symbiodinium necroappetens]
MDWPACGGWLTPSQGDLFGWSQNDELFGWTGKGAQGDPYGPYGWAFWGGKGAAAPPDEYGPWFVEYYKGGKGDFSSGEGWKGKGKGDDFTTGKGQGASRTQTPSSRMRGSLYAAAGLTIEDLQGQLQRLEARLVTQAAEFQKEKEALEDKLVNQSFQRAADLSEAERRVREIADLKGESAKKLAVQDALALKDLDRVTKELEQAKKDLLKAQGDLAKLKDTCETDRTVRLQLRSQLETQEARVTALSLENWQLKNELTAARGEGDMKAGGKGKG